MKKKFLIMSLFFLSTLQASHEPSLLQAFKAVVAGIVHRCHFFSSSNENAQKEVSERSDCSGLKIEKKGLTEEEIRYLLLSSTNSL